MSLLLNAIVATGSQEDTRGLVDRFRPGSPDEKTPLRNEFEHLLRQLWLNVGVHTQATCTETIILKLGDFGFIAREGNSLCIPTQE